MFLDQGHFKVIIAPCYLQSRNHLMTSLDLDLDLDLDSTHIQVDALGHTPASFVGRSWQVNLPTNSIGPSGLLSLRRRTLLSCCCCFWSIDNNTHDRRSRNRRHKSTQFLAPDLFIPDASWYEKPAPETASIYGADFWTVCHGCYYL